MVGEPAVWAEFICISFSLVLARFTQKSVVSCQHGWQPVGLEESLLGCFISALCDLSISCRSAQIYANGGEIHHNSKSGNSKVS